MIGTWTMRTCHSRWDRRSGHAGLATPAVVVVIIFTVIGRLGIMDGGLRVTLRDMLGIIVRIFSVLTPSMTSIWSSRYLLSTWRKYYHYHIIIIMANRQSHREGKTRHHNVAVGSHDRHVVQHELPTQRILHLNCVALELDWQHICPKKAHLYWWLFSGDLALNDRRPIKDLDACDLWDCGPLIPAPRLLGFSLASSPAVGTIVEHVHHDWHPLSVTSQFNHFLEERSATI